MFNQHCFQPSSQRSKWSQALECPENQLVVTVLLFPNLGSFEGVALEDPFCHARLEGLSFIPSFNTINMLSPVYSPHQSFCLPMGLCGYGASLSLMCPSISLILGGSSYLKGSGYFPSLQLLKSHVWATVRFAFQYVVVKIIGSAQAEIVNFFSRAILPWTFLSLSFLANGNDNKSYCVRLWWGWVNLS